MSAISTEYSKGLGRKVKDNELGTWGCEDLQPTTFIIELGMPRVLKRAILVSYTHYATEGLKRTWKALTYEKRMR